MELSENFKIRLDVPAGESQQERLARLPDQNTPVDPGPNDEAESAMRRALGLLGDTPRHRTEADRPDPAARSGGGFNGGLHRRRFVQDGDIPVTVLRRDPGHEVPVNRTVTPVTVPTTSRLQRTEAALAAETAAREKAERALSETWAAVRDLQTKIGHADLAKNEAIEALRRERDAANVLRAEADGWKARLEELSEQAEAAETAANAYQEQLSTERQARRAAEKALRTAEAARDEARDLVRTLTEQADEEPEAVEPPPPPARPVQTRAEPKRPEPARVQNRRAEPAPPAPVRRGRPPVAAVVVQPPAPKAPPAQKTRSVPVTSEPEPVKWWLSSKPAAKRR
jgi:hypothetical protein